jgi:hypothetical protein
MPEVPRRGQDPSFQLGPGSKKESKDGPPVVFELHVRIKHMQTKKHGHQCHALQCSRAKKKKQKGLKENRTPDWRLQDLSLTTALFGNTQ